MKIREIHSKSILAPSKIYDYVIVDRMNYAHANKIYLKHGWRDKNTDAYFDMVGRRIAEDCARLEIACRSAYQA